MLWGLRTLTTQGEASLINMLQFSFGYPYPQGPSCSYIILFPSQPCGEDNIAETAIAFSWTVEE